MFNPIKLYNDFQVAQLEWIRKHPAKFVTLNVALTVVFVGTTEYWSRREMRKFEETAEMIHNVQ